jgi:DNA-binding transcriptional ArsR family regulator
MTEWQTLKPTEVSKSLMKAASHPIRVQAYSILAERVASPKEVAYLIKEDVSNVSYHIRELVKLRLIEPVTTRPRRGATEHFYRSVQRPLVTETEWREFSPEQRENFTTWAIQLILIDVARSMSMGLFDERPDRHLTRTPFQVDEKGWRELVGIHLDAFTRSLEVQARSDERRAQSGEPALAIHSAMLLFEGSGAVAEVMAD